MPGTGNLIWAAPAAEPGPGCEARQAGTLALPRESVAGARVEIAAGRVLTDDRNPADALSRD